MSCARTGSTRPTWCDDWRSGSMTDEEILALTSSAPAADPKLPLPLAGEGYCGASAPRTAFSSASARNGLASSGASGAVRLTASVSL